MTESAAKEFELISTEAESMQVLHESVMTKAPVYFWLKGEQPKEPTLLKGVNTSRKLLLVKLPKGFDYDAFREELAGKKEKGCLFNIQLARLNLFFVSELVFTDRTELGFKLPEKMYKVQRRKSYRLTIPSNPGVKIQVADPTREGRMLYKKLFDLSASGLSFMADESEAEMFAKGERIDEVQLTIRGSTIRCSGEIRYFKKVPKETGSNNCRVGIIFERIKPMDEQKIAAYIFEETRKLFARYF